jgi:hypothetical protein
MPVLGIVAASLLSALCWGGSDFLAGLVSRRSSVLLVMVAAEALGMVFIGPAALALLPGEMLWAGVAGVAGVGALGALYLALATGQMGVVAPVSGVTGAVVAVVLISLTQQGLPGVLLQSMRDNSSG